MKETLTAEMNSSWKISNGNGTQLSPIWSVIISAITKSKSDFSVYQEYDNRPNWATQSLITN